MTDDPMAEASSKVMSWAALASTAAEALAQVAAVRAREKAERERMRAQMLRAKRQARYARDRLWWQPMLDHRTYSAASVKKSGLAWAAARSWKGDPEADRAGDLAEARLRYLRPDVMRLYDIYCEEGMDPIRAMRGVAFLMDRPPAHPTAPERIELTVPRTAQDLGGQSFPDTCVECSGVGGHRETCSSMLSVNNVHREWLKTTVQAAERFYAEQVEGSWVPNYLRGRQLDDCLKAESPWQIGYAPAGWTALVDHMRERQYSDEDLLDAGLASKTKDGRLVDRFRDRLMISARDTEGNTVGFVGRANPASSSQRVPKYLNSPETIIYKKGEILLGLSEQRDLLRAGAQAVVVEGAFDAMALTSAGDGRYVGVAPSGTAVTEAQMRELRPDAGPSVVFAMDGDMSGQQATVRAHAVAHEAGFEALRAAVLPTGRDPADLLAEGRVTLLLNALDNDRSLADLVVDARLNSWPHDLNSVQGRVNAARSAAATIAELPTQETARQVGRVAQRLDVAPSVVTAAITDAISPPADGQPIRVRGRTAIGLGR